MYGDQPPRQRGAIVALCEALTVCFCLLSCASLALIELLFISNKSFAFHNLWGSIYM